MHNKYIYFGISLVVLIFKLIFLRISGLDNLASVRLPTVVEGLQGRETVKEETGDDRPNPLR